MRSCNSLPQFARIWYNPGPGSLAGPRKLPVAARCVVGGADPLLEVPWLAVLEFLPGSPAPAHILGTRPAGKRKI